MTCESRHQCGRTCLARSLDADTPVAATRGPVQVDYYTSVRDLQNIETSAPLLAYPALCCRHPQQPPPSHSPTSRASAAEHPAATEVSQAVAKATEVSQAVAEASRASSARHCPSPAATVGGGGRVAATEAALHASQGLIAAPHYGPATVTKHFIGYTKFRRMSGKWLDTVDLHMPSVTIDTFATWLPVPDDLVEQLKGAAPSWHPLDMPWHEHLRGGM